MPVSLVAKVGAVEDPATDGVVLQLADGAHAVVGNTQSLRQKFVSLATVLAREQVGPTTTIDLRVPAAPVLTLAGTTHNVAASAGG